MHHVTQQSETRRVLTCCIELLRLIQYPMADRRRQEIEEKRAKLTELRRARDERKAQLVQAESAPGPSTTSVSLCTSASGPLLKSQPLTTSRKDVNDLVDSLLQRPASPYSGTGRSTPLPPAEAVRASSALGQAVGRSATPPASIPPTPSGRLSRLSNASGAREREREGEAGEAADIARWDSSQ